MILDVSGKVKTEPGNEGLLCHKVAEYILIIHDLSMILFSIPDVLYPSTRGINAIFPP
jgi:hypothetical protein